jgi:D-alanyl-D-alanine carboxypeptidase
LHAAAGTGFLHRTVLLFVIMLAFAGCTTTSVLTPAIAPLPSEKYAAIVVDANSREVLYQYDADLARYPASLTKMMTLYMLFESIDSGLTQMTDQLPVSANAARRPPSKLGLKAGQTIDVRTAVMALCVKSANDVATVVAEYLGGTEERFAAMMTAKARQLGMNGTVFANASGLPDTGQRTTARDMAVLAMALRARFPHHYHFFSNQKFAYAGKTINGHNNLLG